MNACFLESEWWPLRDQDFKLPQGFSNTVCGLSLRVGDRTGQRRSPTACGEPGAQTQGQLGRRHGRAASVSASSGFLLE